MTIQDMAAALAARDAGISQAVEHCESVQPDWSATALSYLRAFAIGAVRPFSAEDVREWAEQEHGFYAASERAWGGVVRGAKGRGEIVKVGSKPTKASNGAERATYQLAGKV